MNTKFLHLPLRNKTNCRITLFNHESVAIVKELIVLSEKIKTLRENAGITQSDLAKMLGLTRSAVNAWEMGLSAPSTQYVVALAKHFQVSTDYLLGLEDNAVVSVKGLSEKQIAAVISVIKASGIIKNSFIFYKL